MRVGGLARIFSWLWLCCAVIANADVIHVHVFDDKNNKEENESSPTNKGQIYHNTYVCIIKVDILVGAYQGHGMRLRTNRIKWPETTMIQTYICS